MVEKQDDVPMNEHNPYEMIVLAAREAARINASRIGPQSDDVKPAILALERVARGEVTPNMKPLPPDATEAGTEDAAGA